MVGLQCKHTKLDYQGACILFFQPNATRPAPTTSHLMYKSPSLLHSSYPLLLQVVLLALLPTQQLLQRRAVHLRCRSIWQQLVLAAAAPHHHVDNAGGRDSQLVG